MPQPDARRLPTVRRGRRRATAHDPAAPAGRVPAAARHPGGADGARSRASATAAAEPQAGIRSRLDVPRSDVRRALRAVGRGSGVRARARGLRHSSRPRARTGVPGVGRRRSSRSVTRLAQLRASTPREPSRGDRATGIDRGQAALDSRPSRRSGDLQRRATRSAARRARGARERWPAPDARALAGALLAVASRALRRSRRDDASTSPRRFATSRTSPGRASSSRTSCRCSRMRRRSARRSSALAAFAEPRRPELVLGAEARGFILGGALAYAARVRLRDRAQAGQAPVADASASSTRSSTAPTRSRCTRTRSARGCACSSTTTCSQRGERRARRSSSSSSSGASSSASRFSSSSCSWAGASQARRPGRLLARPVSLSRWEASLK